MSRNTPTATATDGPSTMRDGVLSALLAYSIWGAMPVYFKLVGDVGSLEVLAHRIIWAVPFGALIILARRQGSELLAALRSRRTMGLLMLSAVFIAINWLVYIRAVQSDNIFQASLGYYINPLVYVVAGVLFFNERLNRLQAGSVLLAAAGVVVLTISGAAFPGIALTLAVSFTIYGVIRKAVAISGMAGLAIETAVLFPAALVYLVWLIGSGRAAFGTDDPALLGLLLIAGPLTVLPLLFFALAARRLPLATLGFLQFLAPTAQFFMGLLYGEVLTVPHMICFGCIWLAVLLFAADAWRRR